MLKLLDPKSLELLRKLVLSFRPNGSYKYAFVSNCMEPTFLILVSSFVYEMILSMVLLIRSRISSIAASGKRDKDGIKAHASSTVVSAITRFISAATSNPWSSNSSPSSVSFRKVVSASCRLSNSSTNSSNQKVTHRKDTIQYRRGKHGWASNNGFETRRSTKPTVHV